MRILYLTSFIPKRNASQAGVNVTFDIIETIKNNYINSKIDVAGLINQDEYNDMKGINVEYIENQYFIPVKKVDKVKNVLLNLNKPVISSVRYDQNMVKLITNLIEENNYDYVIIDYTQNIAYIDIIKKANPNVKVAIVEHDVSFLSFERKYTNEKNYIKKNLLNIEYKRILKYEKDMLKKYDYIFTLNYKDRELLKEFSNVGVIIPYFNRFELNKKEHESFNIMFWGAMNRKENEDAVVFFVDNIWPYINNVDNNIKFYIVGSKPTERIKELACENIVVTGFVEDPKDYFNIMDLSVIPLRYGAGIKIKVLESLAAGIPVITSDVGAEGINLKHNENSYIANSASEFIECINYILDNKDILSNIKDSGLRLINANYDIDGNINSLSKFFDR